LHLFGFPLIKTLFKNTILIGRTKILVNASDDSKVVKVEFYVDGKLVFTDEEATYEYTLKRIGLFKELFYHKHIISVKAYDDAGKTSLDELEVWARL
ncbi:MAG TPA: Ig-like domain-containing protein, partial [Candidatus Lokiarchaeia archaeon]